jgi:hypothetical protein
MRDADGQEIQTQPARNQKPAALHEADYGQNQTQDEQENRAPH